MPAFRFAIVADSHFHPPGLPEQAAWEADRWFNDRNAAVVDRLNRMDLAFVVHLGDVPHPVPGLAAHDAALDVASALYARLRVPFHVVPGNHDIGDKPKPTTPVPADPAHRAAFEARWGPLWQRFDHDGLAFLCIDTPVLNTGRPEEAEQWAWLEAQVAALDGQRWMAFLHYPPFLLHPDEREHYDNLAEPARSRLLALLATAEASFCGHVHHAFWHVAERIHLLPSTAFVRPGYREFAPTGPGAAFGRDDTFKLGFYVVHVDDRCATVEHVRHGVPADLHPALRPGLAPPRRHPLGVTLRHRWDRHVDIPADGLDPFGRKEARDDLPLLALLEAGVTRLRLPLTDATLPRTRARLDALVAHHGLDVRLFATEAPPADLPWPCERITPRDQPPAEGLPWAPVTRGTLRDGERFSHFPTLGLLPEAPAARDVVRRVPHDHDIWSAHLQGVGLVELPRAGESEAFTNDARVACRVAEALLTAVAFPERRLYLDGWVDHDRGYYPRNLLVDRAGAPRAAHRVLVHLARLLPDPSRIARVRHAEADAYAVDGAGTCWVPTAPAAALPQGIDLATGCPVDAGPSSLPRWVPA